jgi:hypothetical protein
MGGTAPGRPGSSQHEGETMTRYTVIAATLLAFLAIGCTQNQSDAPQKLTESSLKGTWKAIENDGEPFPDGQNNFFTFLNGKCTFSRIQTFDDGSQPEIRQQVEPCQLNTDSGVDRLLLGETQDAFLTVSLKADSLSLTLNMPDGEKSMTKLVRGSLPASLQALPQAPVNDKPTHPEPPANTNN